MLEKKEPKLINVGLHPIMIVGEKMGKQRKGQDKYALEGNRTGDFVHEAIKGIDNVILTNIVNYYYPGNFNPKMSHMEECLNDLKQLIEIHQPCVIIALGNTALEYLIKLGYRRNIKHFPHPSWINRFKSSERHLYINQIKDTIRHYDNCKTSAT